MVLRHDVCHQNCRSNRNARAARWYCSIGRARLYRIRARCDAIGWAWPSPGFRVVPNRFQHGSEASSIRFAGVGAVSGPISVRLSKSRGKGGHSRPEKKTRVGSLRDRKTPSWPTTGLVSCTGRTEAMWRHGTQEGFDYSTNTDRYGNSGSVLNPCAPLS